ncbi:MAG: putative thiol:disulfide interchange protein DsbE [Myxococcales bacterium]|nr:putative thiol:disulfide interchange protein DsbE [Myxococcales bacterium]
MTRSMATAALLLAVTFSSVATAGVGKGQRAPEFTLASLKGPQVSLSALRGKVVLIDFWAQWCEPCKKELPQLEKLAREYAGKGVVIVAVNIDKQRENAERMAKQLGLTMDVLLDPAGSVASSYDLPKMPTSFVVDKKGIVRYVNEGFDGPKDVERFKQELDELTK